MTTKGTRYQGLPAHVNEADGVWLDAKEAAQELQCSTTHLYGQARKGRLFAKKAGGAFRFWIPSDRSALGICKGQGYQDLPEHIQESGGTWLSSYDAASMLGVSRATINNRANAGEIYSRRIGNKWRFWIPAQGQMPLPTAPTMPAKQDDDVVINGIRYNSFEAAYDALGRLSRCKDQAAAQDAIREHLELAFWDHEWCCELVKIIQDYRAFLD